MLRGFSLSALWRDPFSSAHFVKTRSFKSIQGNRASCSASLLFVEPLFRILLWVGAKVGVRTAWFMVVLKCQGDWGDAALFTVSVHSSCDSVATWFIHRQFVVWRLDLGAPLWSICFADIHSFRRAFPADCWRSFRCRCSGDQVCLTVSNQVQAQVSISSLFVWSRAHQMFQSIPVGAGRCLEPHGSILIFD